MSGYDVELLGAAPTKRVEKRYADGLRRLGEGSAIGSPGGAYMQLQAMQATAGLNLDELLWLADAAYTERSTLAASSRAWGTVTVDQLERHEKRHGVPPFLHEFPELFSADELGRTKKVKRRAALRDRGETGRKWA